MSRSLAEPQRNTFIEVGSVYLTDLLIENATELVDGRHDQWPYSSYNFLSILDKYSNGKWLATVGQEKMLCLTNVLCDQLALKFRRYS